jgi:hypothetical protein
MEEQSFYKRYKDSIIRSRKKWLENEENREKFRDTNRFRLQLYKNSYKKLEELLKNNRISKEEMDSLKEETKTICDNLKEKRTKINDLEIQNPI